MTLKANKAFSQSLREQEGKAAGDDDKFGETHMDKHFNETKLQKMDLLLDCPKTQIQIRPKGKKLF